MSKPKAPKVDPSQVALNNAQVAAFGEQMKLNREQFDFQKQNAEQIYATGLREQARQNELADTAFEWAQIDRERGDRFYDEAYAYDPEADARANAEQWRGDAAANSQQQVSSGMGQLARGLQRIGVNPNSGKYVGLSRQSQVEGSLGTAANINNAARAGDLAVQAAKAEKLNVRGAAAGRGTAGSYLGMTGNFGLAGLGAGGAGFNAFDQAYAGQNRGAGVAQGFASNANSGFNSIYQQKLERSQSGGSGIGGLVGGIAGSFFGGAGAAAGQNFGNQLFPSRTSATNFSRGDRTWVS